MRVFKILFKNGKKIYVSERIVDILIKNDANAKVLIINEDKEDLDFMIDKSQIVYILFDHKESNSRKMPSMPKSERAQLQEGVSDFPNDEFIIEVGKINTNMTTSVKSALVVSISLILFCIIYELSKLI